MMGGMPPGGWLGVFMLGSINMNCLTIEISSISDRPFSSNLAAITMRAKTDCSLGVRSAIASRSCSAAPAGEIRKASSVMAGLLQHQEDEGGLFDPVEEQHVVD